MKNQWVGGILIILAVSVAFALGADTVEAAEPQVQEKTELLNEEDIVSFIEHEVRSGDTLYGLSLIYFQSPDYQDFLAEYNDIQNPVTDLQIGMKLHIPRTHTHTGLGKYISIDTANNMLTLYENNREIRSFPVATGRDGKTPKGTYQLIAKLEDPWYIAEDIPGGSPDNPLGSRWLGFNVPGTNGSKYGIHGTNDPDSIGKSISNGCIRMHNEDVEWLYEQAPMLTAISIR